MHWGAVALTNDEGQIFREIVRSFLRIHCRHKAIVMNWWWYWYISFKGWINPFQRKASHTDAFSPFVSITSIFLLQSERLQVLLHHISSIAISSAIPPLQHPLTSAVINLYMQLSSSLLNTWLHQINLAFRALTVIHATPRVLLMTSFFFLTFSETRSLSITAFSFRSLQ